VSERWKYMVVELKPRFIAGGVTTERLGEELERLGNQGWELVQVLQPQPMRAVQLVLKRSA
jgi:hypothetical protein